MFELLLWSLSAPIAGLLFEILQLCFRLCHQGRNKGGAQSAGLHSTSNESWGHAHEQLPVQCCHGAVGDTGSHTVLCSGF